MLNKLTKANAQQRTITVNMGNQNYVTLPIDNSNIKIDVIDDGVEQIVNINVIDTTTNKPSSEKYKMVDVPATFNIDLKSLGDKKTKDASSQGDSWIDGLSDWWSNTEFYFESGGDVSVGIQAGAGFEVNDTKLKVQANLASMTLLSGSARQVGSDTAPWEFNGRYIGKNGITNVKQSIAIPLLGYEHSFDTYGEGYIYGTEVHQFNVGPVVGNNQGVYRFKLGVGAAFILGVNGYVEFGVRPR